MMISVFYIALCLQFGGYGLKFFIPFVAEASYERRSEELI